MIGQRSSVNVKESVLSLSIAPAEYDKELKQKLEKREETRLQKKNDSTETEPLLSGQKEKESNCCTII